MPERRHRGSVSGGFLRHARRTILSRLHNRGHVLRPRCRECGGHDLFGWLFLRHHGLAGDVCGRYLQFGRCHGVHTMPTSQLLPARGHRAHQLPGRSVLRGWGTVRPTVHDGVVRHRWPKHVSHLPHRYVFVMSAMCSLVGLCVCLHALACVSTELL